MAFKSVTTVRGTFSVDDVGDGEPILMIHSLGTSRDLWTEVIPHLDGYRCIAPDILGHGDSSKPKGEYTIPLHADSLVDLMDAMGGDFFHVVGTSLGALIALDLSARYPNRVRSLVLNGCPGWHLESQRTGRMESLSAKVQENGLPKLTLPPQGTVRPHNEAYVARRKRDLRNAGRYYLSSLWAIAAFDPTTRLPLVECPTLVLMGEGDFHLSTSFALADGIHGARMEVLNNVGHLSPYDDPILVGDRIAKFIEISTTKPSRPRGGRSRLTAEN